MKKNDYILKVKNIGDFHIITEKPLDKIVYIPPCTRNVFMKYYTSDANNVAEWTEKDARAYKLSIATILKDFKVSTKDKK